MNKALNVSHAVKLTPLKLETVFFYVCDVGENRVIEIRKYVKSSINPTNFY